ncbi:MAG: MBOAT family protein [Lachnospiraceae bacterium]|jgi:alginate O-acetyltransferase complex protein AlgI|nr:MBOAT family protein [Lachnospiraceae bacterium]
MSFSSFVFLWIFMPVVLLLCVLIRPPKYQNILLLIASLLFYAWGDPQYIVLLLLSILMNWALGLWLSRAGAEKKLVLILALVGNLGLLGYYKYANFAINTVNHILHTSIPMTTFGMPLGISFFTFSALTYIIDLYRGRFPVQKSPLKFALFLSFFPRLVSGPIARYSEMEAQLTERVMTKDGFAEGFRRFIYGLGKKVIIANVLAKPVDVIFAMDVTNMNGAQAWIGAAFYTLELYYDFSGYTDMAIGIGRMMGFDIPENFNYPYISKSITEFWRRWHITLGTWFREYLYIPLGGNRRGKIRTYVNLFVVFAVTGLWHGASWNFVGWGIYHGFFMIIERMGLKKVLDRSKVLSHIYAVLIFTIGWVFFRVGSVRFGFAMVLRMLLPWKYTISGVHMGQILTTQSVIAGVLAVLGCGLLQSVMQCGRCRKLTADWKNSMPEAVFCLCVLLCSIVMMASNTYNPFIYAKF